MFSMFSFVSLSSLLALSTLGRADLIPFIADKNYDDGVLGSYPMQDFKSTRIRAPWLNIMASSPRCDDDGQYIFLNPRGRAVPEANPMILDSAGTLVWTLDGKNHGETYNLGVQEYKGEQYLTFWGGNDAVGGHGEGLYYEFDSHYNQIREISSVGLVNGDLHEFYFTDNATAIFSVYEKSLFDLTPLGGPENAWVWDGSFQEIDLETGELLFQWKSTSYYTAEDCYHKYAGGGTSPDAPFDYYHINSVQKDEKGNYLVSARYTHSVSYIDGKTGQVLWQLGGKRNNFIDLSEGRATNFRWQHDAQFHENGTIITLFDNGAEAGLFESEYSRGMRIRIDTDAMTAQLETEYINPQHTLSSSQGSMQVLENGNVLVGFGYDAVYTEFSANGVALCDVHFAAQSSWETGDVQSYRVRKHAWVGRPTSKPDLVVEGSSAYVSWNGATEVHRWVLEESDYVQIDGALAGDAASVKGFEGDVGEAWFPVQTVEKVGFETELRFGVEVKKYVRVVALDKDGRVLAASLPGTTRLDVDVAGTPQIYFGFRIQDSDSTPLVILICLGTLATAILGVVNAGLAYRRKLDRVAFQKLLADEANDVVEVGDEEQALLDRRLYAVEEEEEGADGGGRRGLGAR
ncbi:arylsulfotransferase [Phyllosticta paracitricarpa]|uniref:Arylsulfotransferase n=2 Tax=Phyllosticta TaxID=121621 RepID=A0ABR1MAK8_9PEZI